MKLLFCRECRDVVRLVPEHWRTCKCGSSGGQYNDDWMTATVGGSCAVFGIANPFFHPIVPYLGDGSVMEKWRELNGYRHRDIWYGEYPGDQQIFRIKDANGPRLKIEITAMNEEFNSIRVIDKRSFVVVEDELGLPFGRIAQRDSTHIFQVPMNSDAPTEQRTRKKSKKK